MVRVLGLSVVLGCVAFSASAACPAASYEDFWQILRNGSVRDVVFFATWCAACRDHVRRADAHTLLIGVFDDPERLSRAVARVNPHARCVVGADIGVRLGVKAVPVRWVYQDGTLRGVP